MPTLVRPGFEMFGQTDVTGQPYRAGASQIFASRPDASGNMQNVSGANIFGDQSGSSNSGSFGTPNMPASISPPNISQFQYSTDSQNYPTFLRNLGENQAQMSYQREMNSAGPGNSVQALQHAQDNLNMNRLSYMSQAGQQQLGVDNAMSANQDAYQRLLAQLYGIQVGQRGQDVGAMASMYAANQRNSGVMSLGGSSRSGSGSSQAPVGAYYGIEGDRGLAQSMQGTDAIGMYSAPSSFGFSNNGMSNGGFY